MADILNKHEIESGLARLGPDFLVMHKKITGSTNNDAKEAKTGKNLIIAADEQSEGRGRYGKSFFSGAGGLYFSIKIYRPEKFFGPQKLDSYPLIMAEAAKCAVYDLCGVDLHVKPPNDLMYNSAAGQKKIAGILTETSIKPDSREISYLIAGIGINVNTETFPGELQSIASSLKLITGKTFDRADLLCAVTANFMKLAKFN
ncbi:MAG: biotin--[acetyl-CoA-carboxylase] ligase [Oscillospiraceae bacterium]|nr:biotin--[acetyl-CoA-carboxylase] ligase [Oscillospiraceae bacterium]